MDTDTAAPSLLVRFYLGAGTDTHGRRIDEIWSWDDQTLELTHDFIQWLFPLAEPSAFNLQAPCLTATDIDSFHRSETLREHLATSYERMLRFYGLHSERATGSVHVVLGSDYDRRKRGWLNPNNHNHLRLTRIMTSTAVLGLRDEARALQGALLELAEGNPRAVTRETAAYWRRAIPEVSGRDDRP